MSRTPLTLLAERRGDSPHSAGSRQLRRRRRQQRRLSAPPKTASGKSATLGVETTSLGKILDNGQGRTLYLFQADKGHQEHLLRSLRHQLAAAHAARIRRSASGANASMVGTTKRSDGKTQVTYNGHPLYTFKGDSSPGDTSGQGVDAFGGLWYAVSPAGQQVTGSASNSSGGGPSTAPGQFRGPGPARTTGRPQTGDWPMRAGPGLRNTRCMPYELPPLPIGTTRLPRRSTSSTDARPSRQAPWSLRRKPQRGARRHRVGRPPDRAAAGRLDGFPQRSARPSGTTAAGTRTTPSSGSHGGRHRRNRS